MRKLVLLVLAATVMTLGCGASNSNPGSTSATLPPPPPSDGAGQRAPIIGSTDVLSNDVESVLRSARSGKVTVGTGASIDVPADILREITALLLEPTSYDPEHVLNTEVEPSISLLISDGKSHAAFVFNFKLTSLTAEGYQDGDPLGYPAALNFSPTRAQLVRLLKRACPGNETIQKLTEQSQRIRLDLSREGLSVMTEPEKIECFRIVSKRALRARRNQAFVESWQPTVRLASIFQVDIRAPLRDIGARGAVAYPSKSIATDYEILNATPDLQAPMSSDVTAAILDDRS